MSHAQWVQTDGLHGSDVLAVAVSTDGSGGRNLFAEIIGSGIFHSANGGTSCTMGTHGGCGMLFLWTLEE
ncbi:MAG: hypothetical protein ACLP05_01160 [Candidatus Kryptoniota bacterium]